MTRRPDSFRVTRIEKLGSRERCWDHRSIKQKQNEDGGEGLEEQDYCGEI